MCHEYTLPLKKKEKKKKLNMSVKHLGTIVSSKSNHIVNSACFGDYFQLQILCSTLNICSSSLVYGMTQINSSAHIHCNKGTCQPVHLRGSLMCLKGF